jgi:hypothetical protein
MDKILVFMGASVHYVTEDGVHLSAMVVKVWPDGVLNLSVFIDHSRYTGDPVFAATSVPHSEEHLPNTWHAPEPIELPRKKRDEE